MRASGSSHSFGPGGPLGLCVIGLLAAGLSGCTLTAGKKSAVPPPPPPAVAPPAPEPPLSVPQTSVVLPSPQPVNLDAIPPIETAQKAAPEKTEPAAAPPRAARRPAPARQEPEPEADAPAAPPPEQPQIQPIVSADEQKRIRSAIESRRREIGEWFNRAKSHTSNHNQDLIDRINSFLNQSSQAERRGDYTQADVLSERALILARELQVD